jgi:acetyltransferase
VDLFPAVSTSGRETAFYGALHAVLKDPDLDAVLIHFVAGLDEYAPDLHAIRELAEQHNKVVVIWLMGRMEGSLKFREAAREAGMRVYEDVVRLAECLHAVSAFSAHQMKAPAPPPPAPPAPEQPLPVAARVWDEYESKRFLSGWGIPTAAEALSDSAASAQEAAAAIGYPVVVKALVKGVSHKTEQGLVKLDITDSTALAASCRALEARLGPGGRLLVQKQAAFEYELIAGFLRDPQFGACVMFGLGGILAELEPDVVFAPAPLWEQDALEMIRSIRNRKLLQGFRGLSPLDEAAAARILVALGQIGAAFPEIEQIDINPLAVEKGSPVAVDATVVRRDSA